MIRPLVIIKHGCGTVDMPFMICADNKLITGDPAVGDENTRFVTINIPKCTESVTISGTSVNTRIWSDGKIDSCRKMASILVLVKTRFRFG